MSGAELRVGFIPLVDAAPVILAHELGFAQEVGLTLVPVPAPSWSALRDRLVFGEVAAAHMLSAVPVASALGLGGLPVRLDALSILSVNGDVIGVSQPLAARMRDAGFGFDFADAVGAGRALIGAATGPLRIGVPFPFSMHAELVQYWLSAMDLATQGQIDMRTIPPPMMAQALAADEVDVVCVGEPWGSIAVESGAGELLLPGSAIWARAPEKVLAVRHDWTLDRPDLATRLIRAVWRAGRWLDDPENHITAAEIMARPPYLNMSPEVIERSLSGRLVISGRGESRLVPGFVGFHHGAATFPWRSLAAWIACQMAGRLALDRTEAMTAARAVFRTDLYRSALTELGAEMPGASEKIEGALARPTPAASASGRLFLQPDQFFDGRIFDPDRGEC